MPPERRHGLARGAWLPLAAALLSGCALGPFGGYSRTEIAFDSAGKRLRGTLSLPRGERCPCPVAIFVHGDGALGREVYGYYAPFRRALAARGIGVFSWDKPGVGDSEGDWLGQNMDERAAEVVAAFERLRDAPEVNAGRVGAVGFSQAGWVLPRLAGEPWVDYLVFVSTAVSWREQGDYLTRRRLESSGAGTAERRRTWARERAFDALLDDPEADYADYLAFERDSADEGERVAPMSEARFAFVRRNRAEDATRRLADIEVPVLALFGEADLNVDVHDSIAVYSRVLGAREGAPFEYRLYPDATHQLSKAAHFNTPSPGPLEVVKINLLGEALFADGMLETLADFVARESGL